MLTAIVVAACILVYGTVSTIGSKDDYAVATMTEGE